MWMWKQLSRRPVLCHGALAITMAIRFSLTTRGVLRYEMVLEGYHSDLFLWDDDGFSYHLRGQPEDRTDQPVWPGDSGVRLGASMNCTTTSNWGSEGGPSWPWPPTRKAKRWRNQVLKIDLTTGEVSHVVDFTQVFQSYFEETRPVQATDPFGPVERRGVGTGST